MNDDDALINRGSKFTNASFTIAGVLVPFAFLFPIPQIKLFILAAALVCFLAGLWRIMNGPEVQESRAVRYSIQLAAADIQDTIDAYNAFRYSNEPEHVADRTIHRPELANDMSINPDIERFQYQVQNATKFLERLNERIAQANSLSDYDALLKVVDHRALELEEAWRAARKTAFELNRGKNPPPELDS